MGQQEVYAYLEQRRGVWHTTKEVAKGLEERTSVVARAFRRLTTMKDFEFQKGTPTNKNMLRARLN